MRLYSHLPTWCLMTLALMLGPVAGWAQEGGADRYDDRYFTVGDHFYAPNELSVALGKPVRFHVANASLDHSHNFMILSEEAVLVGGMLEIIEPYRRVSFEWTPTRAGNYIVACAVCPADEEMLLIVHVV